MIRNITIEICAGSLTDVITASSVPEVDRIELNCSLELGGITPSLNTLILAKKHSGKKIICMVRPRPAGFVYNAYEKETVYDDAVTFLENGADGIVFGSLNPDLTVDEEFTRKMTELIHSYGKEAVFHKAFDEVPDPEKAAALLASCGIDRILTGGRHASAEDGMELIASLHQKYGNTMEILPGGGVSEDNAVRILKKTGCRSIHMTAKETLTDCGNYYAVSQKRISAILTRIRQSFPSRSRKQMTGEDLDMIHSDSYESKMYSFPDEERNR